MGIIEKFRKNHLMILLLASPVVIIAYAILEFTHKTYYLKRAVRYSFNYADETTNCLWLIIAIICILYTITTRKIRGEGKDLIIHWVGPIGDTFFSILTYGAIFKICIQMLRGIFNQHFYKEKFISGMEEMDLLIIGFSILILLIWNSTKLAFLFIFIWNHRRGKIEMEVHTDSTNEDV